ncbi:MAG: translation initiation factor IF-2 [Desulfuromonas sp.]|nr:MAG: translation initiation factor IF-2 [Desulfuromonas sp.]
MAKVRVYELAQKHGLENKDLIARLETMGIEVKNHMSALGDEQVARYEEDSAPKVEKIVEKRLTAGVIRRRRKEVAPPAPEPVVETVAEEDVVTSVETPVEEAAVEKAPEPVTEEPAAEVPSAETADAATATEAPVEEAAVEKAPEPVTEEPAAEVPPTEAAEAKPAEEPAKPKQEVKVEKATASRAKILGRVDIPVSKLADAGRPKRPARGDEVKAKRDFRAPTGAPSGRPARPARPANSGRPGAGFTPAPMEAPPSEKEGSRKKRGGKKSKGNDHAGGGDGFRGGRRQREVYMPERSGRMRKQKKQNKAAQKTEITLPKAIKRIIRISDSITVGELAKRMGVKANELIKELMRQGQMVTINHPLDYESAAILASEFQYEVENVAFDEEAILEHASLEKETEDKTEDLKPRPPVVTIMGHVDHGKTSLLDAIRTTDVTAGEAGGITQHIGAYDVELDGRKITFLDTPGHEAFTSMRSRGAQVTDVVILVVAADDGVMPQTKEAINHAKAACVPIIVAVNKIDKTDANPERVKQELTEYELVPEDWGGETIFVEVSAKQRTNLDQLLEMILLQAEVLELKANPDKHAKGSIVEARLDRGRGPVATVLVQEGTLKIGDPIVAGLHYGRVRTMINDRGQAVELAGPSFPVEVTGLSGVPDAGDAFHAVEDEKVAKDVAQHRQQKVREAELAKTSKISLDQLYAKIQQGEVVELRAIVKADVQGSVEAVAESLSKLSTDACKLIVIHSGVGGVTESDVTLAAASDAIIVGFNVRPAAKASTMAEKEGVDIRLYSVIYDAVDDVKNAMEGLLAPTLREKELGKVEVRETFSVSRIGTIAGCYVTEGKIVRNAQVRLVRDSVVVWTGKLESLKRFKDDVKEVASGYECGIGLENYNDIKIGDVIEAFEMEEVKTTL